MISSAFPLSSPQFPSSYSVSLSSPSFESHIPSSFGGREREEQSWPRRKTLLLAVRKFLFESCSSSCCCCCWRRRRWRQSDFGHQGGGRGEREGIRHCLLHQGERERGREREEKAEATFTITLLSLSLQPNGVKLVCGENPEIPDTQGITGPDLLLAISTVQGRPEITQHDFPCIMCTQLNRLLQNHPIGGRSKFKILISSVLSELWL